MTVFAKTSASKKTLKTLIDVMEKKGIEYIDFDIVINDQVKEFEHPKGTVRQNVSMWVSQTKEAQEEKKPKFFVANGRANYTDGKVTIVSKDVVKTGTIQFDDSQTEAAQVLPEDDGLPF